MIPLKGKVPLVQKGSSEATLNPEQARQWWTRWPDANIGLVTGRLSETSRATADACAREFFAVDVDIKDGGDETWDILRAQHGALPATVEQVTGTGGRHLLFAIPDPSRLIVHNSQKKLGPGLDVRGEGGYIVAAPSIHPETKRAYAWDGVDEIEVQLQAHGLAPAPEWLLDLIEAAGRRKQAAHGAAPRDPEAIVEGGRNDTLFRIAARVRRYGWDAEEIFASLSVINSRRCRPPLPESELRTIAASAAKYKPDEKAIAWEKRRGQGPGARGQEKATTEGEIAPEAADVEAGIAHAIETEDLAAVLGMGPLVKKLPVSAQALIVAKVRLKWGKEAREIVQGFERSLRSDKVIEMKRRDGDVARGPGGPPHDGDAAPADDYLLEYALTDSGNGERVVRMHGENLRYCVEMDKWLVWDGRRWAVDDCGAASQKVKLMARELYRQSIGWEAGSKWALKSESNQAIVAALKRAASEERMLIRAGDLDQRPFLLNCLNGALDLRTGELAPHERAHYITKLCHMNYCPDAECPRFLKFVFWAMGDNPEAEQTPRTVRMVGFLQRAFGYALTGDVSEKAAFVFWGAKGNNGKTTLLTVMRMLFPEYSALISIDTLMTQRGGTDAGLRADLADLRGARLVITSEVEKEHRLSEGKLKYITAGTDAEIKSCRKYENPITFRPTHKLFMDCNHRPAVRGTDNAIWRRLKPVPFEISIEDSDPDMDKKLQEKLQGEAEGILAWTARGCAEWLKNGLGVPAEIGEANTAWREHDDPLKEFLEDCCVVAKGVWVKSSDLSAAYAWWCKKTSERFGLGREAFHERVLSKGFEQSRSRRNAADKQMRTWEGIAIKEEVQSEMDAAASGYKGGRLLD